MKLYQVMNFQHQPVKVFKTLIYAIKHIEELRKIYPTEGFYVVELNVVHSVGDVQ